MTMDRDPYLWLIVNIQKIMNLFIRAETSEKLETHNDTTTCIYAGNKKM